MNRCFSRSIDKKMIEPVDQFTDWSIDWSVRLIASVGHPKPLNARSVCDEWEEKFLTWLIVCLTCRLIDSISELNGIELQSDRPDDQITDPQNTETLNLRVGDCLPGATSSSSLSGEVFVTLECEARQAKIVSINRSISWVNQSSGK